MELSERAELCTQACCFVFEVSCFVWLHKDEMFGAFSGMIDNDVAVFGLDLGVREHSVSELGEFVVAVAFVLARRRQRRVSLFCVPSFKRKESFPSLLFARK